jgi:hypothetical protein
MENCVGSRRDHIHLPQVLRMAPIFQVCPQGSDSYPRLRHVWPKGIAARDPVFSSQTIFRVCVVYASASCTSSFLTLWPNPSRLVLNVLFRFYVLTCQGDQYFLRRSLGHKTCPTFMSFLILGFLSISCLGSC